MHITHSKLLKFEWDFKIPILRLFSGLGLAVIGDHLYAVGGYSGTTYLNPVEKYDPEKDSWCVLPRLRTPRAYFAIATIDRRYAQEDKNQFDNKKL